MRSLVLAVLAMSLVLVAPVGRANADDAGLGRDTSAGSPGFLTTGTYVGYLDPSAGDEQDAYHYRAPPHAGVSVTVRVPPTERERVVVGIEERDCWYIGAPPCVGDLAFNAEGEAEWSGGTLYGAVEVYIGATGGPLSYEITVEPHAMADPIVPDIEVLGDGPIRQVRVSVANAGAAPSAPALLHLRADHVHGTLRSVMSFQPVGLGSAREIGDTQVPGLASEGNTTVEFEWNTTGELGSVELQALLVQVPDAQWWNNGKGETFQAGVIPAPVPDPLNTIHSGRHLWGWTYAVGTRSPNGDPGVIADAYVDLLILRVFAGANTAEGPYVIACGGRCERLP